MATIAFFSYLEGGGLRASLRLATDLRSRGHDICYLGLEDGEQYVKANGFEYISIYRDYFPRGYFERSQQEYLRSGKLGRFRILREDAAHFRKFGTYLVAGGDEELIKTLKHIHPALVLFQEGGPQTEWAPLIAEYAGVKGAYLYSAISPSRGFGIPPIHTDAAPSSAIRSWLRCDWEWIKIDLLSFVQSKWLGLFGLNVDFEEIARRLARKYGYVPDSRAMTHRRHMTIQLPEIIGYPKEFDFPGPPIPGRDHVENFVYPERQDGAFPRDLLVEGRPLIYCALGTLLWFDKEQYRRFFQTVVDASSIRPQWQWVLAIGSLLRAEDLSRVPSNVIVVDRAPQLELLKRVTMMITHGGTNSIMECIYFGVPMIVFPLGADQPGNAARVIYHGLGVGGDVRKVDVKRMQELIETVDRSYYIRMQIKKMQAWFREMEAAKLGVKRVEQLLS